jgi:electron transfer flavoprotein alpha/beta subunit
MQKQIRIAKIDNVSPGQKKKWDKYELDRITLHVCHSRQKPPEQSAATKEEEERQQPVVSNDLFKEVAAIKAQLLVLVSRLDRIEAELQTQTH